MPRRPLLLLAVLAFVATGLPCEGKEAVWTGLVLATNEPSPKDFPPELARFKPQLREVFGYNQFKLISGRSEVVNEDEERWLSASKDFSVRVDCRKVGPSRYVMELLFFQDKKLLVKTWAKLSRQTPLFLRGPQYGKGQLIIVVFVE